MVRRIRDRDPVLTCRRILLVINAVGEQVPAKVVEWIVNVIDGSDGDIVKIRAFALATARPTPEAPTPSEAVSVIRDVCVRRINAGM